VFITDALTIVIGDVAMLPHLVEAIGTAACEHVTLDFVGKL
jgi:hypothetical protein